MSFPFAFTWLNALHAVRHFHNGADYILEILGQKWGALPNFLALRNRQNLVLGKIIKSRLQLVRFSGLLLKIPDGLHANRNRNQS
jgi:hypothetical protein